MDGCTEERGQERGHSRHGKQHESYRAYKTDMKYLCLIRAQFTEKEEQ